LPVVISKWGFRGSIVAFSYCPVCGRRFKKASYYLKKWEKNEIKIKLPPEPESCKKRVEKGE